MAKKYHQHLEKKLLVIGLDSISWGRGGGFCLGKFCPDTGQDTDNLSVMSFIAHKVCIIGGHLKLSDS